MKYNNQIDTKSAPHRVPPSLNKRRNENDRRGFANGRKSHPSQNNSSNAANKNPRSRKLCFSTPSASNKSNNQNMECETHFAKLDHQDEVQARRIQQRRKQIAMGKNTAGYECYLQQVPKDRRKVRCMDTPSTPDHTLDIPAKRWAGIVKAWRKALHKYDPPDLITNNTAAQTDEASKEQTNVVIATPASKRTQEMEEAAAKGLLVDFGPVSPPKLQDGSPISVMSEAISKRSLDDEFGVERSLDDDGDDSDDELL